MGERDDRLEHDVAVGTSPADPCAGKKALVDLDRVERQVLELAEARDAGAEIVDRDAGAQRAAAFQRLRAYPGWPATALSVTSIFSVAGRDLRRCASRAPRKSAEVLVAQLAARDIDADEQRRAERKVALPMAKIIGRALQRNAAQRDDGSGLFGMCDEIGRRDQSPWTGWFQRSSASKPAIAPSASRTIG